MGTLRFLTAGESHGPSLTAILDGFPAGLRVDVEGVQAELARRQRGYGAGGRMKIEKDTAVFTGGVVAGRTTGGPISIVVENADHKSWRDKDIAPLTTPRPGHADLVGALKFGHRDLRHCLERASARETTTRVAVGALCRQLLGAFDVKLGGYVTRIGDVVMPLQTDPDRAALELRSATALDNDLACPVPDSYDALRDEIGACMKAKDTLGGIVEVFALGLPPCLGSYTQWDRRLDARIAGAMLSVQAMKGVEIGPAFENAGKRGTEVDDEIVLDEAGALTRAQNRAGGLEGGVTTGEPLLVRVAMKPISTTLNPRRTVDLATKAASVTTYERSDFCAVPRAVPILEAMLAFVLADALLEKTGGDNFEEIKARVGQLKRARLDDLEMDGKPWRWNAP
jgi:chorismate synthase